MNETDFTVPGACLMKEEFFGYKIETAVLRYEIVVSVHSGIFWDNSPKKQAYIMSNGLPSPYKNMIDVE